MLFSISSWLGIILKYSDNECQILHEHIMHKHRKTCQQITITA